MGRIRSTSSARHAIAPGDGLAALPFADRIRPVEPSDVLRWLRLGLRDMLAAPLVSIGYGAIFVVIGYALTLGLWSAGMMSLLTPLIAGFLIVAPLLAMGLYAMSCDLEDGRKPRFLRALFAWRGNAFHILTAGLIAMLFMMIWVRLAALIFALFFPYVSMDGGALLHALASSDGLLFLGVGTAVGGVLAALMFIGSAVALPLMLNHKVDAFTAGLVSTLVVLSNGRTMALWAATIVVITGLGLATAFLGLAVALPLLGHATWHAYRDTVRWPDD